MKETDVIIPINPLVKKDSLQIIIVNSKRGTQVIPIESPRLYSVIVQVEEGERVKFSIDEKQTIKMDPTATTTPRSIFTYYTYNLTTEKITNEIDPNCDYFFTTSKQIRIKQPSKAIKSSNKSSNKSSTKKSLEDVIK